MQILVAEDEPDIAILYKIGLEDRNHKVVITKDGEECLEVYHKALKETKSKTSNRSPFDLVILDYRMPRKNGLEVAKEIQKMNPNQRIMFVSAYVMESLVNSVKDLGESVDMLDKPFEFDTFAECVEETETIEANGSIVTGA